MEKIKIDELSLEGLKALVYDLSEEMAVIQRNLQIANKKIAEKKKEEKWRSYFSGF